VDRLDPKTATLHHFTSSSGLPPGTPSSSSVIATAVSGSLRRWPGALPARTGPGFGYAYPMIRALRVGGDPYPISETGERVVTGMILGAGA